MKVLIVDVHLQLSTSLLNPGQGCGEHPEACPENTMQVVGIDTRQNTS